MLWKEQREKQAIEKEVGLVERLLAESEGEKEDDLRLIGSLWAKQMKMQRDDLYKKVVMCLAETMQWSQGEVRILIQSSDSEYERYSQMEKEGLDPFEEIKPFMKSFDPEYYKLVWGVSRLTRPELRQSEKSKSNDESSVNDSELKEFTSENLEDIFAEIKDIKIED
jgi:hypothetical protein